MFIDFIRSYDNVRHFDVLIHTFTNTHSKHTKEKRQPSSRLYVRKIVLGKGTNGPQTRLFQRLRWRQKTRKDENFWALLSFVLNWAHWRLFASIYSKWAAMSDLGNRSHLDTKHPLGQDCTLDGSGDNLPRVKIFSADSGCDSAIAILSSCKEDNARNHEGLWLRHSHEFWGQNQNPIISTLPTTLFFFWSVSTSVSTNARWDCWDMRLLNSQPIISSLLPHRSSLFAKSLCNENPCWVF